MLTSKSYQEILHSKGLRLNQLGIEEIALSRHDALRAIGFLESDLIPILGGDVYYRSGSKIEVAYDNWHSDPVPEETQSDFLRRGWKTAREYIEAFPERQGVDLLFVLVVDR